MDKPRIFLGSSGKHKKLLQALIRGLSDIACVEPRMTSFNPGTSTLERLSSRTKSAIYIAIAQHFGEGKYDAAATSRAHCLPELN